jgi:hypothetical protein
MLVPEGKQMQLLLNVGGPDRVSRVQMAEAVAHARGYDTALIKPVSASSVCLALTNYSKILQCLRSKLFNMPFLLLRP